MSLSHAEIADIIRLIDGSTLDEVVLELGELKIEVRRKSAATADRDAAATPVTRHGAAGPVAAPAPPAEAPPSRAEAPVKAAGLPARKAPAASQIAVCAPMVGTFYRRPSPDAAPFVDTGDHVEAGAALCLVEVMKLYTTIFAPARGRVAQICASDAELVEYDQPLFLLDPD